MIKVNIGYFADGPWSHQALEKLNSDKSLEVKFICARNDKPDSILKAMAKEYEIDFLTHNDINSSEFFSIVKGYNCDLFVSMSFNQIFKSHIINLPKLKTINCHAGKLPFYRGRNILNWALINDEKDFGITAHFIDDGIDTGDIIIQRCYPITDKDDYSTLLLRAYSGCSDVLFNAIKALQKNSFQTIDQASIHPRGFYCSARIEGDEVLSWNQKSREIFNFVRSICNPGPQARTFLGKREIQINKVRYIEDAPTYKGIPGAVIGRGQTSYLVKTADSFIEVLEWTGEMPRIGDRFK